MTLDEGSSLPLTTDIIMVANNHFQGMNFLYQVTVPPRFGHLEHSRIPGMPITAFTHTEVRMNECHLRECFSLFWQLFQETNTRAIRGSSLFNFFCLQVEREYISYIHDGSETEKDSFTIVANQTEISKHSLPCVAHVNITPVNDETPVVTANNGLKVRM